MPVTKEQIEQSNQLLSDLQKSIGSVDAKLKSYDDKFAAADTSIKEQIKRIEADLDAKTKEIQKEQLKDDGAATRVKDLETQVEDLNTMLKSGEFAGKSDEIMERIKGVENVLAKGHKSLDKKDFGSSEDYQALTKFYKQGEKGLTNDQISKYLRTDDGENGGFLVPTMLYDSIMEEVEDLDPVRALSRVFTAQVKTLDVPIRTELPEATYEGEAEEVGDENSKYAVEQMTAYAQHINTPITWDLIKFANYDMISQASRDAAMAFAIGEGNNFVNGTGVKMPEGILSNQDIIDGAIETATDDTLSMVDVVKLPGNLKNGYINNARFFMNQKTLYELRSEQDDNGNFLWRIGGEGMPNNIAGLPFVILPSMPDVADGALAVGVGDFFYGYYILDAAGITLIRDDYSQKKKRIIEFSWFRYNTGKVGISEAFQLLKIK